ncbi:MAG: hypothetical protein ACPGED_03660, partial [Flavobacteriales bacterium]
MKGNLDQFEQSLREAIDLHEVQYDPSQWSKLEKNLPKKSTSNWSNLVAGAAVVATLALGTTAWYYLSDASASSASINHTSLKERNISVFLPSASLAEVISSRNDFNKVDAELANEESAQENIAKANDLANSKSTKVNSNTNSDLANSDSNKGNSGSDVSNSDVPNSENSDNTNTAESTLTAEEDFTAFGVDVKNACEGTSVQFELMTETSQGNYLWNFGDGHFSNEANPSHVY